jgi:uncharacterized cupredoxin-like copper-binding protein
MTPMRLACAAILAGATLSLPASIATANPAEPTVNITLASYYFNPNPIYLAGGVPVRLVFTNRAGQTHEFDAPEFFRSARILSGSASEGEVELKKGQSTVIELVPTRGTYKVHCARPFHTMLGMTARIVVS